MGQEVMSVAVEKYPASRVVFHGGEPGLVGTDYIRNSIALMGDRDYFIQSNLIVVPDKFPELINDCFDGKVGTSFDYFRLSFLSTWLRNVLHLSLSGIKVYSIITVSQEFSLSGLERYISLFEKAGGAGFQLQMVRPIKTAPVTADHYLAIYDALKEHPLNMLYSGGSGFIPGCGLWGIERGGNCSGNGVRTIEPNGDVYVCPLFAGQKVFKVGNILDSHFSDSVLSPGNKVFYDWENALSSEDSKAFGDVCHGECVSMDFFANKSLVCGNDPFCDVYRKIFGTEKCA
jgi:radical SAM protein with 4Fe4S-binding SPASM domain